MSEVTPLQTSSRPFTSNINLRSKFGQDARASARINAMKDVTDNPTGGSRLPGASALSSSLALAARRQHVDRVLQEMSGIAHPARCSRLTATTSTVRSGVAPGVGHSNPALVTPGLFQTPAWKQCSTPPVSKLEQTSGSQDEAQHASLTVKTVTYNVSPSPLRADPSQSHTINEFLQSCHSIQHGAALHEMPPLPPDVGISMENLLLDQICRLCQERAALVAKQQNSEQLIKHLEERVAFLEDCLDQRSDTPSNRDAKPNDSLALPDQAVACATQEQSQGVSNPV